MGLLEPSAMMPMAAPTMVETVQMVPTAMPTMVETAVPMMQPTMVESAFPMMQTAAPTAVSAMPAMQMGAPAVKFHLSHCFHTKRRNHICYSTKSSRGENAQSGNAQSWRWAGGGLGKTSAPTRNVSADRRFKEADLLLLIVLLLLLLFLFVILFLSGSLLATVLLTPH